MAGMDALNDDTFGDMGADALNDDTFGDDDTFGADIGPPGGSQTPAYAGTAAWFVCKRLGLACNVFLRSRGPPQDARAFLIGALPPMFAAGSSLADLSKMTYDILAGTFGLTPELAKWSLF